MTTINALGQIQDFKVLVANLDWDLAIRYSIDNRCVDNMQLVLKAYGMRHDAEYAKAMLVSLLTH